MISESQITAIFENAEAHEDKAQMTRALILAEIEEVLEHVIAIEKRLNKIGMTPTKAQNDFENLLP